jgi:hypothetical protein
MEISSNARSNNSCVLRREAAAGVQQTMAIHFDRHTSFGIGFSAASARAFRSTWTLPLVYCTLTLSLCIPLLLVTYLPLVDYPNHLARVAILSRYDSVPLFRQAYKIAHEPIANLAIDSIAPPLVPFGGIFLAGKLFLILTLLVYALGCYELARSIHGRPHWMALVPLPFFYNSCLLMGFVNYVAGIGVFLLSFAMWLRFKDRWSSGGALLFAILATACYFSHLSAWAMLAVAVITVMAWDAFRVIRAESGTGGTAWHAALNIRSILITGLCFVPGAVLYLILVASSGRIGAIGWNSVMGKAVALLSVVRGYEQRSDVMLIAALAVIVCLALVSGGRRINPRTMLSGLVLLTCFIVCPTTGLTGSSVDARLVWPAYVLIALSWKPRLSSASARTLLVLYLACFAWRTVAIDARWRSLDQKSARVVRTFQTLPTQATIYPAFFAAGGVDEIKVDHVFEHAVSYAVIMRDAYVPTTFAFPGQQPLRSRVNHPYHDWQTGHEDVMCGYDFIWTYKAPDSLRRYLDTRAYRVAATDESVLWDYRGTRCGKGPL